MKCVYYSDLHLEFGQWLPPQSDNDADVVLLLGDISVGVKGIEWAKEHFSVPVLYVIGNHEFYSSKGLCKAQITLAMHAAAQGTNVTVLDDKAVKINGVNFIGSTLWSDFSLYGYRDRDAAIAKRMLNDYRMIRIAAKEGPHRLFSPNDAIQLHRRAVKFIEKAIEPERQNVLLTHFGVHEQCSADEFQGGTLSPAFHSDLTAMISANSVHLSAVLYGHTHNNRDFSVCGVPVLSNQRGYEGREIVPGFVAGKVLTV